MAKKSSIGSSISTAASAYDWEKPRPPSHSSLQPKEITSSGWDDWGDGDGSNTMAKTDEDEKKRQREEKRLARQKELEAKRAARKGGGGAMKLGSKLS